MNDKNTKTQKNNWPIKNWVFWTISVLLVLIALLSDFIPLNTNIKVFLFALLIGLTLLPILQKMKVGNMLEFELKNITQSVDKLRDTIFNLNINNTQKQTVNIQNIMPDGQNFKVPGTKTIEKKLDIARSLFEQKRYLESIQAYRNILEEDCDSWIVAMILGFIYLSLEELGIDQSTWGFSNGERLAYSMLFSGIAAEKNKTHYNQYMNLGIAQKHTGSLSLTEVGIKNMEIAYNMLLLDKSVLTNPSLYINKGKARSFMGEFAESLGRKKNALTYRIEAVEIFKSCPEPKPPEIVRWLKDAEKAVERLKKELDA
jgi:tetratricopeptide (TPR) repeat protein